MLIDQIILALIVVAFIFGMIRGVVSQIMALLGLVGAYFLAPEWGRQFGPFVQGQLGCSRFMAEKASILIIGVTLYIVARLIGYGIEKLVVNRVKAFKKLNRIGGGVLGIAKCSAMVAIAFFFLTLVPIEKVKEWAPRVVESYTYRLAAEHNPMGRQAVIERMRTFRSIVQSPLKSKKLRENKDVERLLDRHELKNVLNDPRFIRSLNEGDFDRLQQSEEVEKLMRDDDLARLLDNLDKPNSG
ncbi:MAG: CvpA family protein [Pseudomonadota bacterium]